MRAAGRDVPLLLHSLFPRQPDVASSQFHDEHLADVLGQLATSLLHSREGLGYQMLR
jgi:hypothetical protein